ncbi:MAG TPA: ATP-binding protein, partial [Candidatus Limnocylindria bacterium]
MIARHGPLGRETQAEEARRFLADPSAWPTAVVLSGPPGIGKTTLWRELVAGIDDVLVLTARAARPEVALSYAALDELLAPLVPAIENLPSPRRRALEAALLLADVPRPPDQRAIGLAVADLLGSQAGNRPVMVGLDDRQWLDQATAAVLAFGLR